MYIGSNILTWKLGFNYDTGGFTKNSDKTNKKNKRLQLQEETGEMSINYFTRKKNER